VSLHVFVPEAAREMEISRPIYPEALLNTPRPMANLALCLNGPAQENGQGLISLDSRYLLPFSLAAVRLDVRQIIFTGSSPLEWPHLERAVALFAGSVERLALHCRAESGCAAAGCIARHLHEIAVFFEPLADVNSAASLFARLGADIAVLREARKDLYCRAILAVSGPMLRSLTTMIELADDAGIDRLEFFSPSMEYPRKGERNGDMTAALFPSSAEIAEFRRNFWELLEEPLFQNRLFDLQITRRQLARILDWYDAESGARSPEPPYCRAPRSCFYVDPNGDIRCCPWLGVLGHARQSLAGLQENAPLQAWRAQISLEKEPLCLRCPGSFPHLLLRNR